MITTGIYFRVERDGKWQNILIEDMGDEERNIALQHKSNAFLINLAKTLVDVIHNTNKHLP